MDVLTPFYNDRPEDARLSKAMVRDVETQLGTPAVESTSAVAAPTRPVFLVKTNADRGEHDWLALLDQWRQEPLAQEQAPRAQQNSAQHLLQQTVVCATSARIEEIGGREVFVFAPKLEWCGTAIWDLELVLEQEPLHVELIYHGVSFGAMRAARRADGLWVARGLAHGFPMRDCVWPGSLGLRIVMPPMRPLLSCRAAWHEWTDYDTRRPYLPVEWKRVCVPIDDEHALWLPEGTLTRRAQHAPRLVGNLGPHCVDCAQETVERQLQAAAQELALDDDEMALAQRD
jgi:hypothetical protein